MAANALPFENFAHGYSSSELNAELVERMFGRKVCTSPTGPCALKPAPRAWMNKANSAMAGGRCEGFAVLAPLFFTGELSPVNFGGVDARSLKLPGNIELQREIAYWFATQLVPEVSAEKTTALEAKDVMPFLVEAFKPGATELYRLGIVKKKGNRISGGHALTPIGYYSGDEAGVYFLRVYDNNNPDEERSLRIDTKANRWEYEAARNPKEKSSLFFGDNETDNPMFFAPVRSRLGELPCSFCDKAGLTVQSTGGTEATFNAAAGSTGVAGGEMTTGAGGSVTPSFSAELEGGPTGFLINIPDATDAKLSLRGDPEGAGAGGISAFGPGYVVSLSGLTLNEETPDNLNITGGGTSLQYSNNSRTPLTLSTAVETASGRTLEIEMRLSGKSEDVSASYDPVTGQVNVSATGAGGTGITVVITETEPTGEERSGSLSFTGSDAGVLVVDLTAWTPGAVLTGTVDDGTGPKVVSDGCTNGVKSGTETGVDCGGVCSTKCMVDQGCASGADCASGFCNATTNLCVATSCQDGVRGQLETDIDCGGALCGLCLQGQTCSAPSDCSTGACVGSTCVPTFVVGAAVSGLPGGAALTLQNNLSDTLTVRADGTAVFPQRVSGAYSVTIAQQPGIATCSVSMGAGTATADVLVTVTCVPLWQIGGGVSGLQTGQSVTLANNGGDAITVSGDGSFFFPTLVAGPYAVTVQTQPSGANCVVSNGAGTAAGNVGTVSVTCVTGFLLSGAVSGLPASNSLQLLNNGGDPLVLSANGAFTFAGRVNGAYAVTIGAQPTGATCVVNNGSGTATADVTNVSVSCTATHLVSGTVTGLPATNSLQLLNNGGDALSVSANGAFVFAGRVTGAYSVTLPVQPTGATCVVNNASGTASADVTNVTVSCTATHLVSGTLSGLPVSESIQLLNNGVDSLPLSANGAFVFAARVTGAYDVTIGAPPSGANCVVNNGTGTASADVTNITVSCTPTFNVLGNLSGLPPANTVELLNNGSASQMLGADGAFVFSGVTGPYDVTVGTQPVNGNCVVNNGSGTATADVFNVTVVCTASYTISGTLSGLPATNSIQLLNNGVDPLLLTANGGFSFPAGVTNLYSVTIDTQPVGANCEVTFSMGVATADVTNVTVTCLKSGTLDTTFGGGAGYVRYVPNGFQNEWFSVSVNPDDTQLWVGKDQVGGADDDWVISKLTTTGALDSSFGTGGHLRINRANTLGERARDLRLYGDGRMLVAGRFSIAASFDIGLARVLANGTLDATYGTGGVVTANLGAHETVEDMYLYPSGEVLVVGRTGDGTAAQAFAARFDAAGALDLTFGTGGVVTWGTAGVDDEAMGLQVDGAGSLYIAGFADNNSVLVKLTAGGVFDATFGTGGTVNLDLSGTAAADVLYRIAIEASGDLLVGGTTNGDFLLARFSTTGALDPGFGTGGVVIINRLSGDDVLSLLPLANGKLLFGGRAGTQAIVCRLNTDGTVDTNFGVSGFFGNSFVGAAAFHDLTMDSRALVGGGHVSGANADFGAIRLNP